MPGGRQPANPSRDRRWTHSLLGLVFVAAALLRWHNLWAYNTWDADDGGAHVAYVNAIVDHGRLPTVEETYLAWHEPGYYLLVAAWETAGRWMGLTGLDWWEALQLLLGLAFVGLVWRVARYLAGGNRWVALAMTTLFAFLFTGVKLSAYVTNELLAQVLMLLAVERWLAWRLWESTRLSTVAAWAALVGAATLTKLTAVIVLLAAVVVWALRVAVARQPRLLLAVGVSLAVVGTMNLPWLAYKQQRFGAALSINLHERANAQPLWRSAGWSHLLTFNLRMFVDQPYWLSRPHSFASILISDTFGDHYNLFSNTAVMARAAPASAVVTGNGRTTTLLRWQAMLWVNRIGLAITGLWVIGLAGSVISAIRNRTLDWPQVWVWAVIAGGWAALVYNNLRFPYLERGVLKAAFIYASFPLLAAVATTWWWQTLRHPLARALVLGLPVAVYLLVAFPILWV